jgi:hypothetical protein
VQPKERREHPVILYSIHFVGQVADNRGRGLQMRACIPKGIMKLKMPNFNQYQFTKS